MRGLNIRVINIRGAEKKDCAAIQSLTTAPNVALWTLEAVERALTSPDHIVVVVQSAADISGEPTGPILGFIAAHDLSGGEYEVENLAVAPSSQRQGVGRTLVKALISRASRRGATRIFLEVRESNLAARALYGKAGFRESGRRLRYYSDPDEDAILMNLPIDFMD